MITIGSFEIRSIQTGTFRLDGGAMFGVVPRVLWRSHEDVDDENRILLAARTLLCVSRHQSAVMLVDTGTGPKWQDEEALRFDIQPDNNAIEKALANHYSLTPADVTDVIITHLHFDHNGGLTYWSYEEKGETALRFPNARHWIHRRQWEHARKPSLKDRASFLERDFDLLVDSKQLHIVDGDTPESLWTEISFFVSDGHTPGQLLPWFSNADRELIFTGDVIPTSSHLRPPWVMAYDLEPLKTIDEKLTLLKRCRENGSWLAFPHDHRLGGGILDFAKNKPFIAKELEL